MKISKETDFKLFHDAKVGLLKYDYENKKIEFHLYLDSAFQPKKGEAIIKAAIVESLQIMSHEPWGKGIYISQLSVEEKNGHYIMIILLNSGATFVIDAKAFELEFKNE
jgi:hypothetical protein